MQPTSIKFLKLCLGVGTAEDWKRKWWTGGQAGNLQPGPSSIRRVPGVAGKEHPPVDVAENQKATVHGHPREVNSVTALLGHCSCPQNRGEVGGCPLAAPLKEDLKEKTVSKPVSAGRVTLSGCSGWYIAGLQGDTFLGNTYKPAHGSP